MSDVPNAEASVLLSQYLFCQDYGEWVASKVRTGTFTISAGLIDTLGRASPLVGRAAALTVELACQGKAGAPNDAICFQCCGKLAMTSNVSISWE
jgi:hypothetical protein